jgi:DNA-binding response OmpR family regulator
MKATLPKTEPMVRDRILVVDDDPDNRAMIGHFLTNWGFAVDDAKNGKVALEKVKASPPSLVLLDLEMPEMDGFETCERLKTDPDTEWIPVIIFTGLEKMPHRIRGFRHGADDYVVKTVEPDELRTRIDLVLKRTKRYATLAAGPAPEDVSESPAPVGPTGDDESAGSDEAVSLSLSLSRVSFPEAMRLVLAHGKNGIALLTNGDRSGSVHIHEGAVIHASVGEEKGSEAFYELALWKTGKLDFEDTDAGREKTILTSTRSLLVEASRRSDAWSSISSKVKSFDLVPKWIPLSSESIRLTSSDWAVLRLVDGHRTIREIVDELKTDIFEAGRVVYSLLTVGVLRLDETPDQREEVFEFIPRRGDASLAGEPFELTAQEWDLLSRVDGSRTLGSIREAMNLPAAALMRMARSLKDKGFLQLVGREPKKRKGA